MLNLSTFIFLFCCLQAFSASSPPKDCGGRLTAESGEIATPNYPSTYPYAEQCKWIIEAPVEHVVELKFIDFDVEEFNGECETDEVHVRDGENETAPLLMGKILCGKTIPEVLNSTGRYIFIYFTTSFLSMGGRGFKAIYVTKPDQILPSSGVEDITLNKSDHFIDSQEDDEHFQLQTAQDKATSKSSQSLHVVLTATTTGIVVVATGTLIAIIFWKFRTRKMLKPNYSKTRLLEPDVSL